MKNLFIVNIFSFLLLAACSKSNTECISVSPSRVFNTSGMHFYPETDSISMKDTLWVSINIPKQLKDVLTGESVNYSGGSQIETYIRILGSNIGTGNTINVDGLDYFFICTKTGMSKPSKNYGTPVTYSNSVLQLFATEELYLMDQYNHLLHSSQYCTKSIAADSSLLSLFILYSCT